MIFECLQEYLNKGLGVVNRAIPVKGSLPVLSNVLITAQNGKVKLTATNLETVITFTFGASVSEEGSVTVPAKMFHEYVSTLDLGKIVVKRQLCNRKIDLCDNLCNIICCHKNNKSDIMSEFGSNEFEF